MSLLYIYSRLVSMSPLTAPSALPSPPPPPFISATSPSSVTDLMNKSRRNVRDLLPTSHCGFHGQCGMSLWSCCSPSHHVRWPLSHGTGCLKDTTTEEVILHEKTIRHPPCTFIGIVGGDSHMRGNGQGSRVTTRWQTRLTTVTSW